jgi:hypothetical protein
MASLQDAAQPKYKRVKDQEKTPTKRRKMPEGGGREIAAFMVKHNIHIYIIGARLLFDFRLRASVTDINQAG